MQKLNFENKNIKTVIKENIKYILFLLITTQILILLTGNIDIENPDYDNSDFHKYIAMAEKAPSINQQIIKPFAYRIIIPWLAGIMPFSIPTNFMILNNIGLMFLSISIFLFFIIHLNSEKLAFLLTIFFQLNRYFFLFNTWNYFQAADLFSLSILFWGFILLKRKQWKMMFLLFPASILIKEYILFLIPAGFIYLVENKMLQIDFIKFSIISFLSICTFVLIRKFIVAEEGLSLFIQYKTEGLFYIQPYYLVKRFIIPFTPFGFIPLIYAKRTFLFLREHKYFVVYFFTVIVLSFLGEPERLMAPISAIYFVFIGFLIRDIYRKLINKKIQIYFLSSLFILVFISSIYHLWGIITIPQKEIIMVLTFSTNFLTVVFLIFFDRVRILQNKSIKF